MAKTKLLGEEREKHLKEQKKLAKKKNKQKRSPARFFKEVWGEVKKVTWAPRKDLFKTTFAVIVFIVIFAVIVGLMDWGFGSLFRSFLLT